MKKLILVVIISLLALSFTGCGDPDFSGEKYVLADLVSEEELSTIVNTKISYYDDTSFNKKSVQVVNVDTENYSRINIALESNVGKELFDAVRENAGDKVINLENDFGYDSYFDTNKNYYYAYVDGYELRITTNSKLPSEQIQSVTEIIATNILDKIHDEQ